LREFEKIMKSLLLFFLFTPVFFSQTKIDSLYNKYLDLHQKKIPSLSTADAASTETENRKCGFGIENGVRLGINSFSPEQQKILKTYFVRPLLDTSIVSPSGFFRIHYNTAADIPNFSVQELAKALDSSFAFEVNYLGFLPPPKDLGDGGDDKYDVYVHPMGRGIYGNTNSENEIAKGSQTFYSYIEMDNAFAGYPTTGINAARVTAAHELHHAIQIGNYILRESDTEIYDLYFYELTSTSMEEFVFDSINDYYYYLKTNGYFNFTDHAFGSNDGYNLAVWNIFLKDKFDFGIIRRQWELMRTYRALAAIDRSLIERKSSFLEAYNEFGLWAYYTNYRTVSGKYFDEAANYPLVKPEMAVNFSGTSVPVNISHPVTSTCYVKVISSLNTPKDTLYFILSNFELESGINNLNKMLSSSLTLSSVKQSGYTQISPDYYFLFTADNPYFWKTSSVFDSVVVRDSQVVNLASQAPFPSPFQYGRNTTIKIPFTGNFDEEVSLEIFSISMNKVYGETVTLLRDPIKETAVVEWNGLSNKKEKLATGVYLYFIKSYERTSLGKLVIVNE